jgi:hypothetical protein
MIEITEGFTGIEVAPDGFPHFGASGYVSAPAPQHHASTGARVTLAFARGAPIPPHTDVRVHFDIAENGDRREILGIPQLTHTTVRQGAVPSYHYRLSHWIPALFVMRFVQS